MRTVNKVGGVNGLSYTEFYGNSTDIKPTDDTVPNGSVFYEIDNNMQEYRWDKEGGEWKKIESSGGGGGGGNYLPLSGGTMSGDIDMGGNNIIYPITIDEEEYEIKLMYGYDQKTDLINVDFVLGNGDEIIKEAIVLYSGEVTGDTITGSTITGGTITGNGDIMAVNTYQGNILEAVILSADNGINFQFNHSPVAYEFYITHDQSNLWFKGGFKGDNKNNLLKLTSDGYGIYCCNQRLLEVSTPEEYTDATNKKYVDDLVSTQISTAILSGDNTDKTFRLKSGDISTELTYADLHIANTATNKTTTLTEQLLSFADTTTTAPYNIRLYPTISNDKPSLQIFNQNGSTNENVVLKNIETPIEDNDAVNKGYVDSKMVGTYVSTKTFTTSTKVPASSEKFIFYTITSVAKTHKLVSATICLTGGNVNSYELLLTCYLDTVTDSNGNYTINAYAHNLGSSEIDLNGVSIQCTVAYMD